MAASVAMGLAKAFPLRVDQVGGDAQGPSFVAFGDEGEEHLGLARLGQVAQVVRGFPRSCHAGSLDSLRSRWRCRRGGLGGIHSGTGSKTSEQSSRDNAEQTRVPVSTDTTGCRLAGNAEQRFPFGAALAAPRTQILILVIEVMFP